MARILADENFPQPATETLRTLGHDVLTLLDIGLAGRAMPDDAVLAVAASEGRILVTLNRKHFIQLHAAGHEHAGIIVCTFDIDSAALAGRINLALADIDLTGQIIRVNRPQ